MIKYILQFSRPNGSDEYIVIVDDKPTLKAAEKWADPGFELIGVYSAIVEPENFRKLRSFTLTADALPTETPLKT